MRDAIQNENIFNNLNLLRLLQLRIRWIWRENVCGRKQTKDISGDVGLELGHYKVGIVLGDIMSKYLF